MNLSVSIVEQLFSYEGLAPEAIGLKPRIRKRPAYNTLMPYKPKRTKPNSGERQNDGSEEYS
jgi:hypothetical protein